MTSNKETKELEEIIRLLRDDKDKDKDFKKVTAWFKKKGVKFV